MLATYLECKRMADRNERIEKYTEEAQTETAKIRSMGPPHIKPRDKQSSVSLPELN